MASSDFLGKLFRRPQDEEEDPFASLMQDQPGPNMQAFTQHLANVPEDRGRSTMAKILTVIAGMFHPREAMQAYEMPHERAIENWKLKTQGLGEAAQIEERGQTNKFNRAVSIMGLQNTARHQQVMDYNTAQRNQDLKDYHNGLITEQELRNRTNASQAQETHRHNITEEGIHQQRANTYRDRPTSQARPMNPLQQQTYDSRKQKMDESKAIEDFAAQSPEVGPYIASMGGYKVWNEAAIGGLPPGRIRDLITNFRNYTKNKGKTSIAPAPAQSQYEDVNADETEEDPQDVY